MKHNKLKLLIRLGLLTAMQVVLSRFVSIQTPIMKIGFGFVPIMLAGYMYGWWGGAAVAGISDLIGALLFPSGSFYPGFTVSAALGGVILGLFLNQPHGQHVLNIITAYLIYGIAVTLGANALCISHLSGTPYIVLLPKRLIQAAIMLPVQSAITYLLVRLLCRTNLLKK